MFSLGWVPEWGVDMKWAFLGDFEGNILRLNEMYKLLADEAFTHGGEGSFAREKLLGLNLPSPSTQKLAVPHIKKELIEKFIEAQ